MNLKYATKYNQKAREANRLFEKITKADPILDKLESKNNKYLSKASEKKRLVNADNSRNFVKKYCLQQTPK